jgi:hypothetical protein
MFCDCHRIAVVFTSLFCDSSILRKSAATQDSTQKELFKKKLEGLPLTKTESEYYSRTVKKKVVALANSELHRMAQRLLQQR